MQNFCSFSHLKKTCSGLLTFAHPNNNRISLLDIYEGYFRMTVQQSITRNQSVKIFFCEMAIPRKIPVGCKVMIKSTVKKLKFQKQMFFQSFLSSIIGQKCISNHRIFLNFEGVELSIFESVGKDSCGGEPGSGKGCHQGGISVS